MLTDTGIRRLAARERRFEVQDEGGLSLEIMPSGEKFWRLKVQIRGKVYKRSLGKYPGISLSSARKARDEVRLQVAIGQNPFEKPEGRTFESLAREWLRLLTKSDSCFILYLSR